jgi:hypothetical protein
VPVTPPILEPVVSESGEPPGDDERLAGYARALADGVEAALPGWVEASVERVLRAQGRTVDDATATAAREAGATARDQIGPRVRRLLTADIDEQRTNPLAVIRGATRYPTGVLRAAGARPVPRDAQAREHFPDDVYDLAPARFADLDPALHEPGLVWGAAKAHVHLRRRRAEGRR